MQKQEKNDSMAELFGKIKDSNIVQKCEPLVLMRSIPFTLGELKVLDTYLSRINSHNENCCTVSFTKTEYEELMGLHCVDNRTLKKYTASLLGKIVDIPIDGGYFQFTLFSSAYCHTDKFGQTVVELTCSEQSKRLFFNIEQLHYIRYELKNILALTSKHSYLLYMYILHEAYRNSWEISIEELRDKKLGLKGNETYLQFKYFKRDIIDKAIHEINNRTDARCVYSISKTGKYVTSIRFTYYKRIDNLDPEEEKALVVARYRSDICFGFESSEFESFSDDELKLLKDMAWSMKSPTDVERYKQDVGYDNACQLAVADYLRRLIQIAKIHKAKNLFSYVKKMMENEKESK